MKREAEDPAFYEAHKDDPELWGEPDEAAPAKRRGGLPATITVRFSQEEAEAIRRLAQEARLTYSEVVRRAVQTFTRPRFTIQDGVVYTPFNQQTDVRSVAEKVLETALQDRSDTVTGTSSLPTPARQ